MMWLAVAAFLAVQDDASRADPKFVDDITAKMKNTRIAAIELDGAKLSEFVKTVRDYLDCNFVVSPKVYEKHLEDELKVDVRLKDVSVHTLLKVVLKPKKLTVTVRNRVLMVVTQEEIQEALSTRMYDIRDLIHPLVNFTPPTVPFGIQNPSGRGGSGVPYSSVFSGFSSGGDHPGEETTSDADTLGTLRALIETHTGEGSWETDEKATISFVNGVLVVTQNEKTHRQIRDLLRMIRELR